MTSLKRQLSVGLTLSLIVLLTLQWAAVTYTIDQLITAQMVARLQREGESVLAGIEVNASGQMVLDHKHVSAIYQRPFSGHYFMVVTANTPPIHSRSWWDAPQQLPALAVGEQWVQHVSGPEQQPLLMTGHGYHKQGQVMTVYVGESLAALQGSIRTFNLAYAVLSLLGLVVLLALQRWIVWRALQPLQQIQQRLADVAAGDAQQIDVAGPLEILPLVAEFNRVLTTAAQKTQRSRTALGNLAHALKTRLAQMHVTLAGEAEGTTSALHQGMHNDLSEMHHHIERELKRARLMGEAYPGQHIKWRTEIPMLIETLHKIYRDKTVAVHWQHEAPVRWLADREDMLEVLGNLLDNAFKWCRHQISLTVMEQNGLHLVIEDDGPGCPSHQLDTLVQRGVRADESRPGSGLGLAIVQDVVDTYHGTLQLSHSTRLGGLCVTLRLPAQGTGAGAHA